MSNNKHRKPKTLQTSECVVCDVYYDNKNDQKPGYDLWKIKGCQEIKDLMEQIDKFVDFISDTTGINIFIQKFAYKHKLLSDYVKSEPLTCKNCKRDICRDCFDSIRLRGDIKCPLCREIDSFSQGQLSIDNYPHDTELNGPFQYNLHDRINQIIDTDEVLKEHLKFEPGPNLIPDDNQVDNDGSDRYSDDDLMDDSSDEIPEPYSTSAGILADDWLTSLDSISSDSLNPTTEPYYPHIHDVSHISSVSSIDDSDARVTRLLEMLELDNNQSSSSDIYSDEDNDTVG